MPRVTLEKNLSNLRQYVDNLFDAQVRTAPDSIVDLDPAGEPVLHWFNNDQASMECVTRTFFNLLKEGYDEDSNWNVPSDICLTRFMYPELKGLSMYVPALHRTGSYKHLEGLRGFRTEYTSPVYRVDGYKRYALDDDEGLYAFVNLFLAGAHFVVLHNATDRPSFVKDFYQNFHKDARLTNHRFTPESVDTVLVPNSFMCLAEEVEIVTSAHMATETNRDSATGHSHYTKTVALNTATSYPVITEDKAPIRCPIVCSLIVDTTDWKRNDDYNTFFQLEGWPGVSMGGARGRHAADFATHQATKWNIATYGLCPYSEKRGTTIFLAPSTWAATVKAGWKMPSYAGARSKDQHWITKESILSNAGGVLLHALARAPEGGRSRASRAADGEGGRCGIARGVQPPAFQRPAAFSLRSLNSMTALHTSLLTKSRLMMFGAHLYRSSSMPGTVWTESVNVCSCTTLPT